MNSNLSNRIPALDRMKGFCIFCMLLLSGCGFFPSTGILYQIATDTRIERLVIYDNIVAADFEVPFFVFMMGMGFVLSFNKRAIVDKQGTYLHLAKRYLIFTGLGSIMVSAEYLATSKKDPFIGLTVLMVVVLVLSLTWVVLAMGRSKWLQARQYVGKALGTNLVVLGMMAVVVNAIDMVRVLASKETDLIEIYHSAWMHWSILHTIGITGLLGLIFIGLSLKWKIIAGIIYSIAYTGFQCIPLIEERRSILVLGAMLGTFGYVIVLLAGMIFMELFLLAKKAHWPYLVAVAIISVVTVPAVMFSDGTSRGVSIDFVLISICAYSLMFYIISLFDRWTCKFSVLTWWGRNPLIIFGAGLPLKVVLLFWQPSESSLLTAILYFSICLAILIFIPYQLNKKNIILKL